MKKRRALRTVVVLGVGSGTVLVAGIVTAVNDYINGYVVREAAQRRAVPSAPGQARSWQRQVAAYLTDLAASGRYPHISPLPSAPREHSTRSARLT